MNPTGTPYILPRELTDISDDVRAAPAPALPILSAPFSMRTADPDSADPEMLTEWMNRPHLIEAWEQSWTVDRREQDLRAQLAGTYSRPCIVSFDFAAADRPELGSREVAYVELYRPAKDEIARLYHADPYDVAFHVATAEQELTGRGVIASFIAHMLPAIFSAEPNCRRLFVDPDHRNVAVRRLAEKFGVPPLGEFDIRPDRRITLYTLPRTPADMPTLRH
ncbi:GNAT family N-acetyltransferase [Nocardia sp. NPDC057440]|uniref:GNAT family N-acetyltransferase n=1 Tax=Nocardia sp. NPDC057440 TaxID=3346134 RepID=UPI0036713FFA